MVDGTISIVDIGHWMGDAPGIIVAEVGWVRGGSITGSLLEGCI